VGFLREMENILLSPNALYLSFGDFVETVEGSRKCTFDRACGISESPPRFTALNTALEQFPGTLSFCWFQYTLLSGRSILHCAPLKAIPRQTSTLFTAGFLDTFYERCFPITLLRAMNSTPF